MKIPRGEKRMVIGRAAKRGGWYDNGGDIPNCKQNDLHIS